MIVPKIRFNGYKEEIVEYAIEDIFGEVRNGFVGTATPFYVENGIPYLQSNNVKNNKINKTKMVFISEDFHNKNKKSILKQNDIVMVQSGHAGECAVIGKEFENSNCHAMIVMTPNKYTNAQYCSYYISSPLGQKKLFKLITGSTIRHILASEIKKYTINKPGKEEQQKVATFFTLLDQKIEKQQEKIEKLEELKKGMIQKIFSQEIRFKDEVGGEFRDWESFLFSNVVSNKSDKVNPEDGSDLNMCIELENIESGSGRIIKDTNYVNQTSMKNKFSRQSVLFGKLRPYLKKFWFSDSEGMCSTEIWVLSPRVSNLKKKFLYYFIQTEYFMEYANKSSGSKMPRADWNIISNIEFMIPTIKEQQKISDFLTTLDYKIENEKYKIESLKNQKKGFMQQMFV